jgi:hypothetical protein
MDDYSTNSFVQAFIRFACEVGYPKLLLTDEGSQLVAAGDKMRLSFHDSQQKLYNDVKVEFNVCPVGGHHMHGKVERKIQEIKKSIETSLFKDRLSVLQWETLCAEISNTINDLPLALGNITGDFDQMDLLTPNRLMLGRNNDRSPTVPLQLTTNLAKILKQNLQIFTTWFETWLITHVPKLMDQPKWFKNDRDINIGDIVLFTKKESPISNQYQFGIIHSIEMSADKKIRKVNIRYRNHGENVDRYTYRAVRKLVLIHSVNELSLSEELTILHHNSKSTEDV